MVELWVEVDVIPVDRVVQGMVVKYILLWVVRKYHFVSPLYLSLIIRLTYLTLYLITSSPAKTYRYRPQKHAMGKLPVLSTEPIVMLVIHVT